MNTAWNRWCWNLPSGTALSLYGNRITPIIITDITERRNVRIQNLYTCTTPSGFCTCTSGWKIARYGCAISRSWKCIAQSRDRAAIVCNPGIVRMPQRNLEIAQALRLRRTYWSQTLCFGYLTFGKATNLAIWPSAWSALDDEISSLAGVA